MQFLRCNHCGHLNPADSESLLFCSECGRKIANNYAEWHSRNPEKTFLDFRREVCVEDEAPTGGGGTGKHGVPHMSRNATVVASVVVVLVLVVWFIISLRVTKDTSRIIDFSNEEIRFLLSDTARWSKFSCEQGRFTAFFPGTPMRAVNSNKTGIGDIDVISYHVERVSDADSNSFYSVGYSIYPEDFMEKYGNLNYNIDMIFEGAIMGSLASAGGVLKSSYYVAFGDYPGRAVQVELSGGDGILAMRFYLVGNVMYSIQVVSSSNKFPNRAAQFFFDTFKLNHH